MIFFSRRNLKNKSRYKQHWRTLENRYSEIEILVCVHFVCLDIAKFLNRGSVMSMDVFSLLAAEGTV